MNRFNVWLFDVQLAWSRLKHRPISAIIASWPVIAAVATVTFILGLGAGLELDMRQRLQLFTPTLWVENPHLPIDEAVSRDDNLIDKIASLEGVQSVARELTGPVLVARGNNTVTGHIQAYDSVDVTYILPGASRAIIGRPPVSDNEGVVGGSLARTIGTGLGETVDLIGPGGNREPVTVVGLSQSGVTDIDSQLIIVRHEQAQRLLEQSGTRGFAVEINSNVDPETMRLHIQKTTGLWVRPWYEGKQPLLAAVQIEKAVLFWISLASLITAAIASGGVTALKVVDRRHEWAILHTVGATVQSTLRSILTESLFTAMVGAVIGSTVGYSVCLYVAHRPLRLPPPIGTTYVPVAPTLSHALLAVSLAAIGTVIAATIPAIRGALTDPNVNLRTR